MSKRKTIEDVARLAGVSKVTVSYVLNGRAAEARISDDTEVRVLAAARDLGYRPNALAKMLLRQRTDSLAVAFQYATFFSAWSSFTSEVMRGVCDACVQAGMDLMLHTRGTEGSSADADTLTDGRVDGALILRDADDPTLLELIRRKFPCVLFFTRSTDTEVPFVDADNYAGGRMATQHLLKLGHRRIGMVRGSASSISSNDRFNGYRDALEMAKMEVDPSLVLTLETPSADPTAFMNLMLSDDRPTALFVWSDDVAFALLRRLSELGLSVPDDVSIVGFDSTEACERVSPALTSVRQPIVEMAREATLLLVSLIRQEPVSRTQIIYPPSLDVRQSTAPPKAG